MNRHIFFVMLSVLLSRETSLDAKKFPSESSALFHHLFDPLPEDGKTEDRFNLMVAKTDRQVRAGADLTTAVMQAARLFILQELTLSFRGVAMTQQTNPDFAPVHAQDYLWFNIEEPYLQATGKNLFEEQPSTLPKQFFTIYCAAYTFPYFLAHPLPEPTRTESYMNYLITIRLFLNYTSSIISSLQNILTVLGVPLIPQ